MKTYMYMYITCTCTHIYIYTHILVYRSEGFPRTSSFFSRVREEPGIRKQKLLTSGFFLFALFLFALSWAKTQGLSYTSLLFLFCSFVFSSRTRIILYEPACFFVRLFFRRKHSDYLIRTCFFLLCSLFFSPQTQG